MRVDEAIHYLERIKQEYDCSYEEDALDMAIQALEQEPKNLHREREQAYMQGYEDASKRYRQEPCEDEYIKVPKKALKYRTAGMVAYNAEWLKNHFDIERAVICGAQEPCNDAISRREAIKIFTYNYKGERIPDYDCDNFPVQIAMKKVKKMLRELPPVKPQEPKTGHWIYTPKRRLVDETDEGGVYTTDYRCTCSKCGSDFGFRQMSDAYCKYCGARMEVKQNG
ncbi:MAG: hypothetical protein J6S14_22850 [Clostridia bacterium]|nr:hypothetical protein [Clostridia bacterium]